MKNLLKFKIKKTKTKLILLGVVPILVCVLVIILFISFKTNEFGMKNLESKSRAILSRMVAVRTYVANQNEIGHELDTLIELAKIKFQNGNLDEISKQIIMKHVPINAAWTVGLLNSEKENYEFRIASIHPFNPLHQASPQETALIDRFNKSTKKDTSISFVDKESNTLWVVSPVYLKKTEGCLKCHGDKSTSPWGNGKNIMGQNLLDQKDGDLHGLFILKSDLKPIQKETAEIDLWLVFIGLVLSFIIFCVSIVYSRQIFNQIGGELDVIVNLTKEIANGNLSVVFNNTIEKKGIYAELYKMNLKLSNIIYNIKQGAHSISSASEHINITSNLLSDGASKQAESAMEVGSNMEQICANIEQNADNSKTTSQIAKKASQSIRKVLSTSKDNVTVIDEILEKTKIIHEFAMQTNLLALNAGVEAARAGVHGRGFAVIALEVRKLADKSKAASAEIEKLTKKGLLGSEMTENELNLIAPDITRTALLVDEIQVASEEQKAGAEQINKAIQQLADITQLNASSAEEMAASAEELSSQAMAFREMVDYFKLANEVELENNHIKNRQAQAKNQASSLKTRTNTKGNGFDIKMDDLDNNYVQF